MEEDSLEELQNKFIVRPLEEDDFEQVVQLQVVCFPEIEPWSKEKYFELVRIFPEGQICVELDGKIIGSSCSLIVNFSDYDSQHSWAEVLEQSSMEHHDAHGDTLYGIQVMTDPECRGMRVGKRIYRERQSLARGLNLRRIVVGGKLPNFNTHMDQLTIDKYIEQVLEKKIYDPILTFQLGNGFVIKRILKDYLPEDRESQGYAALLEWSNPFYVRRSNQRMETSQRVRICVVQYEMRRILSFDDFAQQCDFFVDIAHNYRADFVVFPEIFTLQLLSFLPKEAAEKSVRRLANFTDQYIQLFQGLAIQYDINVVAGSHYTMESDNLYNIAYLFGRDGSIDKQYKLHVTPNERRWWGVTPGDELKIFKTDCGPVSIQICYDIEFPELSREATRRGATIFFTPFCTDERKGYLRVRYCAQARCVENQVYVAIAGTTGNIPSVENIDISYAQSAIFSPSDFDFARDGIVAETSPNIETVVVGDVDLIALKRNRMIGTVRNWRDRRNDLYSVTFKESE